MQEEMQADMQPEMQADMQSEMRSESDWTWIEGLFKRIPIPYPAVSLIIGIIIAIISIFFIIEVESIPWNDYYSIQIAFSSALIVYLLIINQYALNNIKTIVHGVSFTSVNEDHSGNEDYSYKLFSYFKKSFKSRLFFLLIAILTLPQLLIDILRVYVMQSVPYEDIFFSSLLFNIYNYAVVFFAYYLLGTLFWIMANTKWILDRMLQEPYFSLMKIDLFSADNIGGLGEIKDFIMRMNIYFSLGISLAMLAYIDKSTGYSLAVIYNVIILIGFLLSSFILFFSSLNSVKKIFKKRMNNEIHQIDEKHQASYNKLVEVTSGKGDEDHDKALKFLSDSMEALHKEREERITILNDFENKHSFKAAVSTIISFVMPLFALYEKLVGFGIIEIFS